MSEESVPFDLDRSRAALIVVDMQNDFVRKGAPFYLEGCNEVIPRVKRVVEGCRNASVPVVYLKFTAGPEETLIWTWSRPLHPDTRACWKGEERYYEEIGRTAEGHDVIDEIYPVDGEQVVEKYSYGGFYETSLVSVLRARGVSQLIILGCAVPFCVDDTVTGAFDRQYRVFLVSDAVGYFDKEFLESSLRRIGMKYGRLVTTRELLSLLDSA